MIGNLNKKIFFLILLIPLLFSCGNVETDNEIGRYQVIEKKHNSSSNDTYWHTYYLLDTKTGDLSKIDFKEIE